MQAVLLDTGPWVALLNRRDPHHESCASAFAQIKAPLATTEAVLTETLYMLEQIRLQEMAFQFVLRGAVALVPLSTQAVRRCSELMVRYADTPMDFADATLVQLAEELDTQTVLTLDCRGFNAYRTQRGLPFRIIP